jgi:hypothetical protein
MNVKDSRNKYYIKIKLSNVYVSLAIQKGYCIVGTSRVI